MHCLLLARHRAPLLALAHAVEECCTALGDVFVQNAPVRWARRGVARMPGMAGTTFV